MASMEGETEHGKTAQVKEQQFWPQNKFMNVMIYILVFLASSKPVVEAPLGDALGRQPTER